MKRLLNDILTFVKNPVDQVFKGNFKENFKATILVLLLELPIMLVLQITISALGTYLEVNLTHKFSFLENFGLVFLFIFGALIMPLLEELVFRGPLKYNKNPFVKLYITYLYLFKPNKSKIDANSIVEQVWNKYFKSIIYLSSFIFAIIHIFNYDFSVKILLISPLLVLPQFILGMLSSFLRITRGFFYGSALHITHNLVFLILAIVVLGQPKQKLSVKNEKLQLRIEEVGSPFYNQKTIYLKKGANPNIKYDSISLVDIDLKTCVAIILNKKSSLVRSDLREQQSNINLYYKNIEDSIYFQKPIISGLETAFKIKVKRETKNLKVWSIRISDTSKLQKHAIASASASKEEEEIRYWYDKLLMPYSKIEELIEVLNKEYKIVVDSNIDSDDYYRFQLPRNKGVKDLSKVLKHKYGLQLVAENKEKEIIIISKKSING